ncbi:hypothetical protein AWB79_05326 [Caballeronia hypogeia]|uniref:Uncharacterized protein n=1 Tax=Caballeronia hypogeia TaxID=1777140 RepID=A0A158CGI5_9BURK|nr:hypothetical protein [Caballeronia hypogeia]SAK81381.1 hypothetical protein AWB79_05326 [Caballeronia hypogeia]
MPTRLEFSTPEGRMSLSVADAQFMAYDAGELAVKSMREFVQRLRAMGIGQLAETYARLLAQNKVSIMELREVREDAEALLASKEEGETIVNVITPRLDALRETIARTQAEMRESVERLAALSAACEHALHQIPGYRPPAR